MRNCILLSLFMIAGLMSANAQDAAANKCQKETVKASCNTHSAKTSADATAYLNPKVVQVASTGTAVKANCKPADCKPENCDPKNCPPECLALCKDPKAAANMCSGVKAKTVSVEAKPAACKSAAEVGCVKKETEVKAGKKT